MNFPSLLKWFDWCLLGNVPPQGSNNDHGKNSGQKEHDDDRIDNRKPMDLNVAHSQIGIPSWCPPHIRLFPFYRVGEVQFRHSISIDVLRMGSIRDLAGVTIKLNIITWNRASFNFKTNNSVTLPVTQKKNFQVQFLAGQENTYWSSVW